ncbi:MAG: KdsC family phosphatase [Aequoribacter sp.]|jgi:3-deoxy-D-manno-octulosonate 8-phosphate phosphatase (KDO 8-P phosphatase)|uniref:KdsC family phosphatase n=1 Tax=Aequoribacter sp. TaxID=2847771 RepID=UPI003C482B28
MTPFKDLQALALDVDGVLSDGRLYYGNNGEELKTFNIRDGLGIKLLQQAGITVAIITGRTSSIVARRAQELGIEHIIQGREDKLSALHELCAQLELSTEHVAYMGDDLPDRKAIIAAGLGATVADGSDDVKAVADWCSTKAGGAGAVRDLTETWLKSVGLWDQLVEQQA